jgi:D-glycero-alpha-D-manno-heptose-7-phosphate kinase
LFVSAFGTVDESGGRERNTFNKGSIVLRQTFSQKTEKKLKMTKKIINALAPVRVCDIGGWTDTWFARHGRVLNIAVGPCVETQVFVCPRAERDEQITVSAENFGDRFSADPDNFMRERTHALLKAAFSVLRVAEEVAVDVHIFSEIPPSASMGTSAAVSVALIGALDLINGGQMTNQEIAETAQRIETEMLGLQCGVQDHLCSSHGGVCSIDIPAYPKASVCRMPLPAATRWELERRLAVVYLGSAPVSSHIHEQVIKELERSGESDLRLAILRELPVRAENMLLAADFEGFAALMRKNTEVQRTLHPAIIGENAQKVIDLARDEGAIGWKLNGAGGDGGSVTLLFGTENCARRRFVSRLTHELPHARFLPVYLSETGLRRWFSEG